MSSWTREIYFPRAAFTRVRGGARLALIHVNVPQHDLRGVREGWRKYYWKPWKAHLKKTARGK